jgi:hypothetical protein
VHFVIAISIFEYKSKGFLQMSDFKVWLEDHGDVWLEDHGDVWLEDHGV